MKKTVCLILSLLLILSLSTTASATKIEANNGNASTDVQAVYVPGSSGTVVSVEIGWTDMEFTYQGASEPKWDANSHSYSGTATESGWNSSNAKISITNHSNVIIQAGIAYSAGDNFPDSSMAFTADRPYVGSAYTSTEEDGTPCAVSIKAIPGGFIPESTTTKTAIGSITVTVNTLQGADSAQTVLDALNELYQSVSKLGYDPATLARGNVYFASKASANTVYSALFSASELISSGAAEAQVNAALNEAVTALYSALEIKQ